MHTMDGGGIGARVPMRRQLRCCISCVFEAAACKRSSRVAQRQSLPARAAHLALLRQTEDLGHRPWRRVRLEALDGARREGEPVRALAAQARLPRPRLPRPPRQRPAGAPTPRLAAAAFAGQAERCTERAHERGRRDQSMPPRARTSKLRPGGRAATRATPEVDLWRRNLLGECDAPPRPSCEHRGALSCGRAAC